jgi:hypothetical protein
MRTTTTASFRPLLGAEILIAVFVTLVIHIFKSQLENQTTRIYPQNPEVFAISRV